MIIVATDKAPGAIGPYSQAIIHGGLVYCSGQIGTDPASGAVVSGGIDAETRQVLANLEAVLHTAGSGKDFVLKTTVFLRDMNDFAAMNTVYAAFFGTTKPTRATVAVAGLPKGVLVEIDCVAVVA